MYFASDFLKEVGNVMGWAYDGLGDSRPWDYDDVILR